MDVSIIIPTYNRYPFILVSLHALKLQNFNPTKMEVIVVDDGSIDKTHILKKYTFPFQFRYIRNKKNLGLASTRNIGLKKAKGKVIIFLDGEMVVDPNYVLNNYLHHIREEKAVVIGGEGGERLYSFLFPEYNKRQTSELTRLMENNELVKSHIKKVIGDGPLYELISKITSPIQLIETTDIEHFSNLSHFTVPKKYVRNMLSQITFQQSPIAWMACLGNLSVRRSFAIQVGGFDEDFKTWGSEDVEFSYRLYKAGAKFFIEPNLKRYHQEHPETEMKKANWLRNILLFQKKHMVMDVCIRSLKLIEKVNYGYLSKVIEECHTLNTDYPDINEFIESLVLLLHQICILAAENKPIQSLMKSCKITDDALKKERILKVRDKLESTGQYPNLILLFDRLVNL